MKTFGDMAALFGGLAAGAYRRSLSPALNQIGEAVKADVKANIGTYQSAIGPFPATPPLAQATLQIKGRRGHGMGGDPDTPLYATGEFYGDVNVRVDILNLSVEIGTNAEHIARHEVGDSNVPPRPIFGPATLRAVPKCLPALASAGFMGRLGGVWKGPGISAVTFTPAGSNNSFHT